jgi:hypothetical protein
MIAAVITGAATILAASLTSGFGLAGGGKPIGGQSSSAKAAACKTAQRAVESEVTALGALLGSLTIRDAGTANATAIKINETSWHKAASAENTASGELLSAIMQLKAVGTSVDRAVKGRIDDLDSIIHKLPDEVASGTSDDGLDTRQLSDHRDHFQNDIAPAICSGGVIPNA